MRLAKQALPYKTCIESPQGALADLAQCLKHSLNDAGNQHMLVGMVPW